jgi:hypothetical protein
VTTKLRLTCPAGKAATGGSLSPLFTFPDSLLRNFYCKGRHFISAFNISASSLLSSSQLFGVIESRPSNTSETRPAAARKIKKRGKNHGHTTRSPSSDSARKADCSRCKHALHLL